MASCDVSTDAHAETHWLPESNCRLATASAALMALTLQEPFVVEVTKHNEFVYIAVTVNDNILKLAHNDFSRTIRYYVAKLQLVVSPNQCF